MPVVKSPLAHYDTVVVGAGMSGLACASRLYSHARYREPNSLLVLEGRERLGGRINSVYLDGNRLDTGANWIHGVGTPEKPNPLMGLLPHKRYKELSGMVMFQPNSRHGSAATDPDSVEDDWVDVAQLDAAPPPCVETKKPRIIPAEFAGHIYEALWGMVDKLHETAETTPPIQAKSISMLQAINDTGTIKKVLEGLPREYHQAFCSLPAFIENMEAGPLVAQSAEQPNGQPGLGLLEFALDDFEGDQVFLRDGYLDIINEIAKELVAADLIRTGNEIQQIAWKGDPIIVKTSCETYSANKVICTLPLGVLQHYNSQQSTRQLFYPKLPSDKAEAISSLGFGTLDKIFLSYSHAWWEEEEYLSIIDPGIVKRPLVPERPPSTEDETQKIPDSIMGFTHELPGLTVDATGNVAKGPRVLSIINLHSVTGVPALSAFVSCANAIQVEALTDSAAGNLVHGELERWFGRKVPAPNNVHVTRWHQDPFSRGSYTHMITGVSETRHREAFQKAIVNSRGAQLRFAGEHTSTNHFATVHGALLSGWREADAILQQEKAY